MKQKWRCKSCNRVNESDSTKRHCLDECPCGKSYVDLEEHYMRVGGDVEMINDIE